MNTETDDFANDKEIQRLRKARQEYAEMYDECIRVISTELFLEPASHRNMKGFVMFKTLNTPILSASFNSTAGNNLQVSVVEYHSSYRTAKDSNSGTDIYFFGMISLQRNYPPTYIFRETAREKITDLFLKQDVDFSGQKKFSRKFHVITHDKEKLMPLLSDKPLDELAIFPELEIEINGQNCLFRVSRKPVSPEEAKQFVLLAKTIMQILG